MILAGTMCRKDDSCFSPKNDTSILKCFLNGYIPIERSIATIVAPRYVWKKAWSGICRSNNMTARGSRSKITLATINVVISTRGKRRTPISSAGPKWYGVNGITYSQSDFMS